MTELYDAWLGDGIHQYTASGKLKPPPRRNIVAWVKQQFLLMNDESLNTNPFITESDEEHALEEFHPLDISDDEDDFVDL